MKKFVITSFALISLFILAGCSNTGGTLLKISGEPIPDMKQEFPTEVEKNFYLNEEYKFSLDYPKTTDIEEESIPESAVIDKQVTFEDEYSFLINIFYTAYDSYEDFAVWHEENIGGENIISSEEIMIGEYKAIETVEMNGIDSKGFNVYFIKNNRTIGFTTDDNEESKSYLLNEILPTLKFL